MFLVEDKDTAKTTQKNIVCCLHREVETPMYGGVVVWCWQVHRARLEAPSNRVNARLVVSDELISETVGTPKFAGFFN